MTTIMKQLMMMMKSSCCSGNDSADGLTKQLSAVVRILVVPQEVNEIVDPAWQYLIRGVAWPHPLCSALLRSTLSSFYPLLIYILPLQSLAMCHICVYISSEGSLRYAE